MKMQSIRLLSPSSQSTGDTDAGSSPREQVLDSIFAKWDAGGTTNALTEIYQHPELAGERSFVLELAAEEYLRRREAGEEAPLEDFVEKFPGYQSALRRLLQFQEHFLNLGDHRQSSIWPAVGTVFRGFRLIELLGSGAFSQVFLAADVDLAERLVAVKVTKMPGNEPAALGRLDHPNIVPVLSFAAADSNGPASLVMPYLGRTTIEDVLDRARAEQVRPASAEFICDLLAGDDAHLGPRAEARIEAPFRGVDWNEATIRIAYGIAFGLAHAHRHKVLHLDIKPSNILLARDGRPFLLDFNLTRFIDVDQKMLGGTAPYMSPEQIDAVRKKDNDVEQLDERSDLYSLGVLLYELLTGRHPFGPLDPRTPRDELLQTISERQAKPVVPIREHNRSVNAGCARLIESCLAFDRAKRPISAERLAEALRNELGFAPRLRRAALRHPILTRGTVAVAAVVAIGAAIGTSGRPPVVDRNKSNAIVAAQVDRPQAVVELTAASIAAESGNVSSQLTSASALIGLGQIDEALKSYESLAKTSADPDVTSGLIFCLASEKRYEEALALKSRQPAGKRLTADWNNQAYCYLKLRNHERARELIDRAIALEPESGVLRFTRALTEVERASLSKAYQPVLGVADLEFAMKRLGRKGELLYYLAFLKGMMNRTESEVDAEMAAILAEAVNKGYPLRKAVENPFLIRLTRRSDFRSATNSVPIDEKQFKADRLIPPSLSSDR